MQFQSVLTANLRATQETAGKYFLLMDTGAATTVELWLYRGNEEIEHIVTAMRGLKLRVPEGGFTRVDMLATVGATCQFVISQGLVDIDLFAGASVNATLVDPLPLPVSNDRGSPGNLLFVSGVTIADAPATSAPDNAAVACTSVIALILAADATRRQIVFTNIGADPVTLGAAGHTWAKRCVILNAGDTYLEDRAANLAWYGICDAAKTASVTTKTVLA